MDSFHANGLYGVQSQGRSTEYAYRIKKLTDESQLWQFMLNDLTIELNCCIPCKLHIPSAHTA